MSTDRWLGTEDVVHTYDDILLNHRKKEIMPSAAAWMDLVKWSKSERERQIPYAYMWNLKYGTNEPIYKQ